MAGLADVPDGEIDVALLESGRYGPVFLGPEPGYLVLAFDDQSRRDRLHSAGRKAVLEPVPEQRAEFVSDDPIEYPPALLGVDEIHVDGSGFADGRPDHSLGQFVEGDPQRLAGFDAKHIGEMPRDRLSLAVGVGREVDLRRIFRLELEAAYDVSLPADIDVVRGKSVFYVDAELTLRQIAHVSLGCDDFIPRTEALLNGMGLGG